MSSAITIAALGVAAGGAQAYGAHQAANAQVDASGRAINTTQAANRLIQQQQAPYQQIGLAATNQLAQLYGIQGAQVDQRQVGSGVFKPSEIINMLQQGKSVDDILQAGVLGPGQGSKELRALTGAGLSSAQISQLENGTFTPQGQGAGGQPGTGGAGGAPGGAPGQPGAPGTPDYSAFYNSPDYQFALQQGNQAVQRTAAAGGRLASGNTLAAADQYSQGLATQNYQNYLSGVRNLAGLGPAATGAANQSTYNSGQSIADTQVGQGAARASGIAGMYNGIGSAIGYGANGLQQWLNQPPQYPGYDPSYGSAGLPPQKVRGADGLVQTFGF